MFFYSICDFSSVSIFFVSLSSNSPILTYLEIYVVVAVNFFLLKTNLLIPIPIESGVVSVESSSRCCIITQPSIGCFSAQDALV